MVKRLRISTLLLLLFAVSCIKENFPTQFRVAEGTPVTLTIGFGAEEPVDVQVSTKADVSRADESRVHDLYVLVFDSGGTRRYGRYFSYQHKWDTKDPLTSQENENEGWYVENKTLDGVTPAVEQTVGAVKIATAALSDCTLVLLANVSNTLLSLGGQSPLDALNSVATYTALKNLPVRLEQDVVVRNDLFLMLGEYRNLDMTSMTWDAGDTSVDGFGTDYRVTLSPIDAKVKFRVKANTANIKELTPHKWSVANIPSSCYLYERNPYAFPTGEDHYYFDTEPIYFDGEETDANDVTWQTFTFYMLESCLTGNSTPNYSARERQTKHAATVSYEDDQQQTQYIYYVSNGTESDKEWVYAPARAPYVTFSVSMTYKDAGIAGLDDTAPVSAQWDPSTNPQPVGVTGEMSYTVHLGEFSQNGANDYNTKRGHFYTYDITINNASNLYAEVKSFVPTNPAEHGSEDQPGQEGSLLLNSGGVVNCDAHYEYRSIEFAYNSVLAGQLASDPDYHVFSWYVRTPFTKEGSPEWVSTGEDAYHNPVQVHRYLADSTKIDFLWVKFAINDLVSGTDPKSSDYSTKRVPYPGKTAYNYDWYPGLDLDLDGQVDDDVPRLMDINQLINYIYYQYRRKAAHDADANNPVDLFDQNNHIRATAFVDEYYYEWDPFTGQVDPNLWRKFVNADPREMHILSDVVSSRDQKSNLINSSHSIIQRSIQTIYNVDSPELSSIWGAEHKDEIRETLPDGEHAWTGWPWGFGNGDPVITNYATSYDNGRLNSAALWGIYPSPDTDHDEWTDFLKYDVINSIPELKDDAHRKMAYSCLTRNRDNDGDGIIDPEEIRWYMASINQLKGMWVGNESLSTTARVYQPWKGDWRAHVLSSTCPDPDHTDIPKVLNAEEGVATFDYKLKQSWAGNNEAEERLRESVRCVRNVGTYTVSSSTYDISNAPLSQTPDPYYTVEENVDPEHPSNHNYSTYTIRFQRLDPRSLREYTDKELPFHNEKSSNNRVYLELHVQSPMSRSETPDYADDAAIFTAYNSETGITGLDMGDINEAITNEGYNKFCPAGYRLPNQTELAIMTLTLPSSYWNHAFRTPSRTYFSHGYYAPQADQKPGEGIKLGWVYTSNILLPNRESPTRQHSSKIRCVRDSDMTGVISGKMYLANSLIMPGESTTLTFNFSSAAAAFESGTAKLYLCYSDGSGNPVETEIPLDKQPSGLHYRESQTFTAPDPATLDPAPGSLPTAMQLKLVLSNVRENSEQTFYTSFTLVNVSVFCDFEILPGKEAGGFPINVTAETTSEGARIGSLVVYYKKMADDAWTEMHTFGEAANKTHFEKQAYFNPGTLEVTTYLFKVVATSGLQSYTTKYKAMEFVKVDFTPNVTESGGHEWTDSWWQTFENANAWHLSLEPYSDDPQKDYRQLGVISERWYGQRVDNLDFSQGDFIEADMDLENCVYIKTVDAPNLNSYPYKNQVIGMDNIFSLGKTSVAWPNNAKDELHLYYPAHQNDGSDKLYMNAVYSNYASKTLEQIAEDNGTRPLVLYFDQDGLKSNGAAVSWNDNRYTNTIADLVASRSLYIGAQEGAHLSRATYNYVRVVRNDLSAASYDVSGGFAGDPVSGGKL